MPACAAEPYRLAMTPVATCCWGLLLPAPIPAILSCGLDPIPCTVLDPFGGSGTVGMVARNLGRAAILIELNPKYIELIKQRNNESILL